MGTFADGAKEILADRCHAMPPPRPRQLAAHPTGSIQFQCLAPLRQLSSTSFASADKIETVSMKSQLDDQVSSQAKCLLTHFFFVQFSLFQCQGRIFSLCGLIAPHFSSSTRPVKVESLPESLSLDRQRPKSAHFADIVHKLRVKLDRMSRPSERDALGLNKHNLNPSECWNLDERKTKLTRQPMQTLPWTSSLIALILMVNLPNCDCSETSERLRWNGPAGPPKTLTLFNGTAERVPLAPPTQAKNESKPAANNCRETALYPNHAPADRLAQPIGQQIDKRNLSPKLGTLEGKTDDGGVESLHFADSNQTVYHSHFRPPATGLDLVVEPIAAPFGHSNQLVGAHQRKLDGANGSQLARTDEERAARWLPLDGIGRRVVQRLYGQQAGKSHEPMAKHKLHPNDLAPLAVASHQTHSVNGANGQLLNGHLGTRLADSNQLASTLQDNHHLQQQQQRRRDLSNRESISLDPQTLAGPTDGGQVSQMVYKQLLASGSQLQPQAAAAVQLDSRPQSLNALVTSASNHHAPFASVAGQMAASSSGGGGQWQSQLDGNVAMSQLQALDSTRTRPDMGEDGSSMVSYSLVPGASISEATAANLQGLLQQSSGEQTPVGGSNSAASLPTVGGESTISHDQLLSLMQQLSTPSGATPSQGTDQSQLAQFSFDTNTNQLTQQPGTTTSAASPVDSTVASLFENLIKGALNASSQTQQSAVKPAPLQSHQIPTASSIAAPQQQQQHQPQPQPAPPLMQPSPTMATPPMDPTKQVATSQKFAHPPTYQQQQLAPYTQPAYNPPPMAFGDQASAATMYSQDAMDPNLIYATNPRKKSKKKRKKSADKNDGSRNGAPVIKVQKRPRQSFYEHNSPNDLEPSATFHKWKYPWLYRPPYDDDEDEEEGETEINLRFFNNFSRMGPLGGIARSAAPATFIISLAFLILSNISLAATVIVHGISSFLRNMSAQQQQPLSSNPPRLTGRLARILFTDGRTTQRPPFSRFAPLTTSSTTTEKPTRSESKTNGTNRTAKATHIDRVIRSIAESWNI